MVGAVWPLDGHPVVGFDLDMTLIDSRVSVAVALHALAEETGAPIDVDTLVSRLGPPLEVELSPWFQGPALVAACDRYRAIHGNELHRTLPMPGAREAVGAVRDLGGRVVVVTSKFEPHAWASLRTVGIVPDFLVGWRFGEAKGKALREHGAWLYVGDHVGDVAAAKAAGITSVSVTSGSSSAQDLQRAGTDMILPDLLAFPQWLNERIENQWQT